MDERIFFEFLSKRRSIRAFKSDVIEESKLSQILEACNMAPSNLRRVKFVHCGIT